MKEWLDQYCHPFLQAILRRDKPPTSCEDCGSSHENLWRCLDCDSLPHFCRLCCKVSHRRHPFHRVELYQDGVWRSAFLWQVGSIICLGHGGAPCPGYRKPRDEMEDMCIRFNGILSEPPDLKNDFSNGHLPRECYLGGGWVVTFVHTNGFHHLPVFPCSCKGALAEPLQHIESGYYPATFKLVSTVFTFRLLQHFHLHRVDAHMASESYCSILSRLTNHTFPFLSPVSYSSTFRRA